MKCLFKCGCEEKQVEDIAEFIVSLIIYFSKITFLRIM